MVTVPARILVVDDERGMREVLSTILGRAGHSVVTAADGQEALQLDGSDIFDLVITDLKMPGRLGGMEILKAVKDIAPDTVLLVLTAYATRSEEHTSELQSLAYLVCRLLLEKKKQ